MCLVVDRPRELRIRTERSEAEGIRISVEDSGLGVAPEHRDRIFEPFFTTKPHGMGMGLMFCRSVVESLGGRLGVTENMPHGVAVWFTLPVDEAAVRPAGEPRP
jgi:signal transduction histidine kinase